MSHLRVAACISIVACLTLASCGRSGSTAEEIAQDKVREATAAADAQADLDAFQAKLRTASGPGSAGVEDAGAAIASPAPPSSTVSVSGAAVPPPSAPADNRTVLWRGTRYGMSPADVRMDSCARCTTKQ
jgi:hypothetical protein